MCVAALNKTRGTILAQDVEVAGTFWARLRGLLGRQSLQPGEGLLILPCDSIHMFFMRFSIDAVYLDRSGMVIAADKDLHPWHIGSLHRHVRAVLELPVGAVDSSGTSTGDCISIGSFFSE